jgi:hypothetical protein
VDKEKQMSIKRASELLNIPEKEFNEFSEIDPFNGFRLSGYISRHGDHRYGAMVIVAVDGVPCEQVIYATPKLHYPFDKHGKYVWPSIDELHIYEKLDGTNILAYQYFHKGRGEFYTTYKTRLSPVLKQSQFGDFLSLWKECLIRYPWVQKVIDTNIKTHNLSFELYGNRNPITVEYETDLSTALLFGVDKVNHHVKPPTQLQIFPETLLAGTVPHVFSKEDADKDPTQLYNSYRASGSQLNKDSLTTEGSVFYVHSGGKWHMFKCKPEEIEKIHWAAGGIPQIAIYNTIINAYEDMDQPDIPYINQLLLEEYTQKQIDDREDSIAKLFKRAKKQMDLKKNVNEVYRKAMEEGFDIKADKNGTLRWMSQFFSRDDMKKVGTVILKQAGLNKPKFRRA